MEEHQAGEEYVEFSVHRGRVAFTEGQRYWQACMEELVRSLNTPKWSRERDLLIGNFYALLEAAKEEIQRALASDPERKFIHLEGSFASLVASLAQLVAEKADDTSAIAGVIELYWHEVDWVLERIRRLFWPEGSAEED